MKAIRVILPVSLALTLQLNAFTSLAETEPQSQPEPVQTVAPVEEQAPTSEATVPKPRKTISLSVDKEALQLTDDIKVAAKQVKENPEDPEAHFLAAAAYSRSPNLEKALKHINKAKKLLKEQKDFEFIDRTTTDYETLLQSRPDDPVVLYRLALAYYLKGYSVERYPQYYKSAPTGTPDVFYGKAKTTMQHVIKLNPKDTWARNYLGYLVSENGKDLSKAINIWEESLAIDRESNPGAYLLLSQAYLQQGDLQNAFVYGAKGLEIKQRMGMTLP